MSLFPRNRMSQQRTKYKICSHNILMREFDCQFKNCVTKLNIRLFDDPDE